MQKLSIIIPIFNEEETILELHRRLVQALKQDFSLCDYEIIFVDDGSSDHSFEILQDLAQHNDKICLIQFSRNFGHHLAVSAGLDYASGDVVVMMDGDLQDQPEELKKLYNKMLEGYDVVAGIREHKKFSIFKRGCSWAFVHVISYLTDKRIIINNTIFRMMRKEVADEVKKLREMHRYLVGIIGWVGFRHTTVSVEHGRRFAGTSKYSFRKQMELAFDAIVSFSDRLLRLISIVGLLLVLVSCLLITIIVHRKLYSGIPVLGWTSLISAILFVGGTQIFILGVLGEYIGRTYMETKQRPLYIIRTFLGACKRLEPRVNCRLHFKRAEHRDLLDVFFMVNDPVVREMSFNPQPITMETHVAWFNDKINRSDCFLYMVRDDQNDLVGHVRFDRKDEGRAYVMSIRLVPKFRGFGLGPRVIKEAIEQLGRDVQQLGYVVIAEIRQENIASLKAFARAGFEPNGCLVVNGYNAYTMKYVVL